MRITLLFIILLFISELSAQEVHFRQRDQKIMVIKGDLVQIDADTAYVISVTRADQLNEKLYELIHSRKINEELHMINKELLDKVKEVERLVSKLLNRMEEDQAGVSLDLEGIIQQLDASLVTLRSNNEQLAANNKELQGQIKDMDTTIRKLKKEIRGIWWNGVADKVVTGVVGVGLGILLVVL